MASKEWDQSLQKPIDNVVGDGNAMNGDPLLASCDPEEQSAVSAADAEAAQMMAEYERLMAEANEAEHEAEVAVAEEMQAAVDAHCIEEEAEKVTVTRVCYSDAKDAAHLGFGKAHLSLPMSNDPLFLKSSSAWMLRWRFCGSNAAVCHGTHVRWGGTRHRGVNVSPRGAQVSPRKARQEKVRLQFLGLCRKGSRGPRELL